MGLVGNARRWKQLELVQLVPKRRALESRREAMLAELLREDAVRPGLTDRAAWTIRQAQRKKMLDEISAELQRIVARQHALKYELSRD
jgi:hypothetical protein